jgi:ketosteroid isomerase-like protein
VSRNVELLKRVYEAWNLGAFETIRDYIDPAVEFREAPEFPGGGSHRGVDELGAAMANRFDAWDKILFEPEEFVENGDEVLAVVRVLTRGKATGIETERVIFHLVTIRDDRILRWRVFFERDAAFEELGLPAGEPGQTVPASSESTPGTPGSRSRWAPAATRTTTPSPRHSSPP